MLVLKFGGTSVGKPERMRKIADLLLSTPGKKLVVLSALSGTTNTLVKIGDFLMSQSHDRVSPTAPAVAQGATREINDLEKHYENFIKDLFSTESYKAIGQEIVSRYFSLFRL